MKEFIKSKFELISFPIPILDIQEKIVNWINQIKNKSKLNLERIEKLKIDLDEKIQKMILEGKFKSRSQKFSLERQRTQVPRLLLWFILSW